MGYVEKEPIFRKQEEEVEEVIEVAIKDLLNDDYVVSKKLSTSYATNIEVPSFILNDYVVWGATAMMLSELKTYINSMIER